MTDNWYFNIDNGLTNHAVLSIDLKKHFIPSDVRMYADDTNLTYASKDPDELLSSRTRDSGNLKQWLDSNRLSLNVVKTKCLFIGTWHKISLLPNSSDICLDGHPIERVDSYKCLGIQVDETLSWGPHISEVNINFQKCLQL